MRIDEQQQLEREMNEHKKKIDMSKNLISIIFKQDKLEAEKRARREANGDHQDERSNGVMSNGAFSKGSRGPGSMQSDNEPLDADSYQYFIKTFQKHGFSFYIEFSDLKFDIKTDFIGGGGYGEVFKAQWIGTPVAVKRFGRKCNTKKNIIDFIKEIEIVN